MLETVPNVPRNGTLIGASMTLITLNFTMNVTRTEQSAKNKIKSALKSE